ncbi:zinc finger domain-containing protein [Sphaerisporangium flaviroseum]|uniref:zinc finger domain-containing protein n=1 Tax=Sphaerisporangium flaviroseum TaxID=509199 RepID=UPI003CD0A226
MAEAPEPGEHTDFTSSSAISTERTRDADEVERHPCPRCAVAPGSPCRSRSGAVAGTYHTGRPEPGPAVAAGHTAARAAQ